MKKRLFIVGILSISFSWLIAQSGKSLSFNGTDQYMKILNHADFNVTTSESFTVTAWINIEEFRNKNDRFVAKRCQSTTLANKSGWELFGANSASQFYAANTPNAAGNHTNSVSVWATYNEASTNTWVHLALVIDRIGGKMYEYINGIEKASSGIKDISSWSANNPFDVFVGCGISGATTATPSNFFKGKIDNLRFYKRALSATELVDDMSSTVSASTPGLVAAYDFENVSGITVADITGNHPGTLVNFSLTGPVLVTTATIEQDKNFTGRGNKNEVLLKAILNTSGTNDADIHTIRLMLNGTSSLSILENVKVYTTGNSNKFDSRNPLAVLLGSATPANGEITIATSGKLVPGANYIWVTADIAANAPEGSIADATLVSMTTSNETYTFVAGNPAGAREVLLTRSLLFGPGDFGSTNYRIPVIVTAADGSLVTLTDKRKYNSVDLPEDIDIVCRRSTDGGKTWSEPVTVALGTGHDNGYGDACIIKTKTGKLVAVFVGGPGLSASTPSNPLRAYVSSSADNGVTWSVPTNITDQLYGSGCSDPTRKTWEALFFGSGQGLCLRDGRIMTVAAIREVPDGVLNNYAVYSDDEGVSWSVSARAIAGGDEAKVVELNDGTILMSSRTSGNRLWATSTDKGLSWGAKNSWTEIWGNACDADIVRYTSTLDGFDKNRILHTLPNANNRTNVTMWMSYDEASTWPVKKTLCEGQSAYSSVTILPDGTIGVYLEEDESIPYKMYFLNFSLDWLTNGVDSYTVAGTPIVAQPEVSLPAGRYAPSQSLTISTATAGASIYYTLDGSMPNKNAFLYDGAIILENSCTLKAIAVKEGMANSVVTSVDYLIGYVVPGQKRAVGPERYVTSATTTGGNTNISYSTASAPTSYYVYHTETVVNAKRGELFTLHLNALSGQQDGLQWCQVIILADWNQDFDFADAGERIAIIGNKTSDNSATVLNISKEITVPADAKGGKTRMRVVYTDAWRPVTYADLGEDPVDKGRMYDFDLVVEMPFGTQQLSCADVTVTNPVKDVLRLQLPGSQFGIALSDLTGKPLFRTTTTDAEFIIPMTQYPSQVYVLHLTDEEGRVFTQKIIKQ